MSQRKYKNIGDTPSYGAFLQCDVVHFELLFLLAGTAAFKWRDAGKLKGRVGWCFAEKVRKTAFTSILQSEKGVRLISIETQSSTRGA
jgi:hypothetical protein